MKKKIFALALSVGMLFSFNSVQASNKVWTQNNGYWKLYEDGKLVKGKWSTYKGNWYHFDKNGIMETGWKFINGNWYSFTKNGLMRINWYKENGKWYYLGTNGDMKVGWFKTANRKWSYFKSSGEMVIDTLVEANDTRHYVIDSNGYTLDKLPKDDKFKIGNKTYHLQYGNGAACIVKDSWIFDYSSDEVSALRNFSDNASPNEEINVKNIISNFKNYKDKIYLGKDGLEVAPTPEYTGATLKILKIVDKWIVRNDPKNIHNKILGNYTIINDKLYYLDGEELVRGYHVLVIEGMIGNDYAFLTYANENGEIIRAKRLSGDRSKFLNNEVDGFFKDKIVIKSYNNFFVDIVE